VDHSLEPETETAQPASRTPTFSTATLSYKRLCSLDAARLRRETLCSEDRSCKTGGGLGDESASADCR